MIWRLRIHIVVLCLPDFWSNWNLEMLVFEERGKLEYPEKNLLEQRSENQQQTQPTYGVNDRIWTCATMVGGECSHQCATLAFLGVIKWWVKQRLLQPFQSCFHYDCFDHCDGFFSILSDWRDDIKIWKPGFIIRNLVVNI